MSANSIAKARIRARRLRLAVVSSALSKASSVIYQIVAVPLIVASVGADGYSQFAVILAAVGWVGPLFVGLGSAVTERIATDSVRPISDRTRTTFVTALAIAGVLLAIFVAVSSLLLVASPSGQPDHLALALAGFATGLGAAGGVFDSALLGLQRSYVTNLMSFMSSLVAVVATAAVAVAAPSVGAMALATLGPTVLARAASGTALRQLEPGLWGRAADIAWRLAPRIAGRGSVFASISLASFLSLDAGLLIVASSLGTDNVAGVALMVRTMPLVLSIVAVILVPLWPAIAEAVGDGDVHWITRTALRAGALVMGYSIAAGLVVIVAGEKLVGLWTGGRIFVPIDLLLATAALIIVSCLENVTQTLLFGLGRAGSVASILLCRSALSLFLVITLANTFGQTAALIGPIISSFLTSSWLLPVLVIRSVRAKGGERRVPNSSGQP